MKLDVIKGIETRLGDTGYRQEYGAATAKYNLAYALSQARRQKGLTQRQMANITGVSQAYIARLESGEANPSIAQLGKLLASIWLRASFEMRPLLNPEAAPTIHLGERVVIKPIEREAQTRGGIYLLDTAKEKPQEGEVVAVGPGRVSDDGDRIPMELAKGDRVIYSKFAGTEYKDGDQEYLILRESDILAKISYLTRDAGVNLGEQPNKTPNSYSPEKKTRRSRVRSKAQAGHAQHHSAESAR